MKVKFIEATNHKDGGLNWGKFMLARFDAKDVAYRSVIDADMGHDVSLVRGRGWGPEHLLIVDLATGEGAIFRPGGLASADLAKHRIWVCPMFEPFITRLWKMDLSDLDALPAIIDLTEAEAPSAFAGYRRPGPVEDDEDEPPLVDGEVHPLIAHRLAGGQRGTSWMKKVSLTDDETNAVRVAIRIASTVHTEMVSMSPDKDVRQMLMEAIRRLHSADQKLGG